MKWAFQKIFCLTLIFIFTAISSPLLYAASSKNLVKCGVIAAAAASGATFSFFAGQHYSDYRTSQRLTLEKSRSDAESSSLKELSDASQKLEQSIQFDLKLFSNLNAVSKDLFQKPTDQWLPFDVELINQLSELRSQLQSHFEKESQLPFKLEIQRISLKSQVNAAKMLLDADQVSFNRLVKLAKEAGPRLQAINQYLELLKMKSSIDAAIEKIKEVLDKTSDTEKSRELRIELEKLKVDQESLQSQINEATSSQETQSH